MNIEYIQKIHKNIFDRFIRKPYGQMFDYTAKNPEETPIPTIEECEKGMPNSLSWWLPIENGSFFTGLYLYALTEQFDKTHDEKLREDIDLLIKGMFLFQDCGKEEGFIARGVGEDGTSHYPLGSDDQTGPWILALYRVWRSDFADEKLKSEIKNRIKIVIDTLYENKFDIVSEIKGVYRGSFKNADWRGACYNLLCCSVMAELFGGEWKNIFEQSKKEHPRNNIYSRLEIVSHGFSPDMIKINGLIQFWINIGSHLCLKELIISDKKNEDKYKQALRSNGYTASKFIYNFKNFIPNLPFDSDFRKLNSFYEPFNGDSNYESEKALKMCEWWVREMVPARHQEHDVLGHCLFAIWTATTSTDDVTKKAALQALDECINNIDFTKLNLCYSFVVESIMIMA